MGKTTVYISLHVEHGGWVNVAVDLRVVVDFFGLLLGLDVSMGLDTVGQSVVVLVLMLI